MPDDPNRFDDDFLGDWLADLSSGEARASGSGSAPWEQFAGRYPEPPGHEQPGPAPWDMFVAPPSAPYEDRGAGDAPWGSSSPPPMEQLDWFAAGGEEAPAESVSLPPPAPSVPAGAEEWLSGFGEAAAYSRAVPAESGDLSWLGTTEEPAGTAAPSAPAADWRSLREEWLAQSSLGEAAEPPAEEFTLPDWLDEELPISPSPADELSPLETELPQESAWPGWLDEEPLPASPPADELPPLEPESPGEPVLPDWLASPEEQEEPRPSPPRGVIRRLAPTPPPSAEPEAEAGVPEWLAAAAAPPPDTVPAGMTYEEWERQQREQEAEAQKTPEERLLEEIPDWFKQLDEQLPAPPPAAPEQGPEFVPGWFLGLEDKAQEAPDWFQRLDLSTGSLAEVTPPAVPEAPAPAEPEVPDWFRAAPLPEGVDWAMLGAVSPPESTEPEQGAVPDWLDTSATAGDRILPAEDIPFPELDLEQVPPLPTEPAEEEEEVEDFVERFEPLEPGGFDRRVPLGADEMPDWLRELPAAGLETEPPLPVPGAVEESGGAPSPEATLDWLDVFGPGLEEAPPVEEMPPFSSPAAPAPELSTDLDLTETAALDSAALDALLSAAEVTEPVAAVPEPAPEAGPVESLQDLEALFAGAAVESEVPDLQRLFDQGELDRVLGETVLPETGPQPVAPPEAAALPPVRGAQPEWVEELRPAELPVTIKAAGAEAKVRQRQVTELPERLRALRERALRELSTLQAEGAEAGPLAGIPDALPAAELAIPAAVSPRTAVPLTLTPEQQQRVQRLQAMLEIGQDTEEETLEEAARVAFGEAEPLEVPALPARRPRRPRRFRLDRLVVMLGMLVALLAPFVTDALHFAAEPSPLDGDGAAVASAVDALQSGQYVLFAFEYGPVAAGELDPLVQAVLRDVLARGAVPLTISTDPAGAFHARAVLAALADDQALLRVRGQGEESLQAGEDYVTLRYLSGEAVGVRSLRNVVWNADGTLARHPVFITDLRGDDTNLPIGSLAEDVALVVVVGDQVGAVRTWAEQLSGLAVPKVALVTAAAEPLAASYVGQDGYAGYLAGVRDTVRYDAERNRNTRTPFQMPADLPVELPDPQTARWHSMALGAAAAAGFIALGTVINLLRALKRRGRR